MNKKSCFLYCQCSSSSEFNWPLNCVYEALPMGDCTMFENYKKCRIFKKSPKWTIFGIFNELLFTQNVNVARFARNVEWDFFLWFSNTVCTGVPVRKLTGISRYCCALFSHPPLAVLVRQKLLFARILFFARIYLSSLLLWWWWYLAIMLSDRCDSWALMERLRGLKICTLTSVGLDSNGSSLHRHKKFRIH